MSRLHALARRAFLLSALSPLSARAEAEPGWAALRQGGIVLFRHAIAPGGGDPPGMRLGDCSTQRNLDAAGRAQARRIGAAFRERGIAVGAVLASAWCRAQDTAALAFPGRVAGEPAFDSFFADRSTVAAQTEAARRLLRGWSGPGALVVVTHQVNITALTGIFPASGEGVVLRRAEGGDLEVAGRIQP
ncbi:histidine phosphatase family protein [Falsiroseomonas selenitidurans]|uniref:Histidine phosphatase family protein n=1 Tax=Falsiroseomonas selenitidurans TaxID=2716335 RepID=A0ABX1E632_9PROT|nr:histidine phosphatase family protein [Falsiroseomonas selenitidurans]NKC31227.1 histidine phosphatase family protein [Falsiroseomonas selenitidurans]